MASFAAINRKNPLVSWATENPLLIREIRRRMRGRLYSWSLIAYLSLLGLASLVIMYTKYADGLAMSSTRDQLQSVGEIGRTLFTGIWILEALIGIIVAPLLTAGIATAEKEKDTFDFLRVTTLRSRTFVVGCLMTTALFLMLVFACTLPILGLTFIFGGVSMTEILTTNVLIFSISMAICSWGIFNSTNYKRSRNVNGSILVIIMLVIVVGPMLSGVLFAMGGSPFTTIAWSSRPFQIFLGVLASLVVILGTAASRRLYDPNNRMYNYKQFTGFWFVTLGLLAGSIVYWHQPWSGPLADPDGFSSVVIALEMVGFFLAAVAVTILSAGRVERGDEVWRLRARKPIYRRIDEKFFLYSIYLATWMGACGILARASSTQLFGGTTAWDFFSASLPLMLASFLVVLAVARLMSTLSESRNRASAGTVLLLVLFWGIVPIVGFGLNEISAVPGQKTFPLLEGISNFMIDVSPFSTLVGWDNGVNITESILPIVIALGLACLLVLPTLFGPLKRRLAIDYDWGETRPEAPEGQSAAEMTSATTT